MKLGRTKEWRESNGLTQRELAAEASVGEVTVARIETGASVTPPTARKIARALGVAVADLMERPPVPLAQAPQGPEQPETGRPISRAVHDSVAVDDDVKARIFEHLDALEHEIDRHSLNGELAELVGQMREVVLAA